MSQLVMSPTLFDNSCPPPEAPPKRQCPHKARQSVWSACFGLVLSLAPLGSAADQASPANAKDLFRFTNIWEAHFTFAPDQWAAMEPKGGGGFGPFGGPRGRPGEPGDGPDRPGGPPPGFGPGMFLGPALFQQADKNHDGKVSKEEFQTLSEAWFAKWDKEKTGKLTADQVRDGLNGAFGGPGAGPGGSRGPGRFGGGMNLQGPEGKRNGVAAAAGIDFDYVHGQLEFNGQQLTDVAVRYKGNGTFMESRGSLKRSLKAELNKYTKGQRLAGLTKLNFHNCVTDPSWMNEVMSYRLYRDAKLPAPRTAFASVYLTVPGKYQKQLLGLYSMVENVDKHFLEANFGVKEGALFKPVTPDLFSDLGDDWKAYNQTYDPKAVLTDQQKQRLIQFCKFSTSASDADFAAKLGDFVDLEEFARFMAVMVFLSDLDGILGPGQNLYVYLHPKTQKFIFIPWDQDHSFGQFPMRGTQEQREDLSIQKPWQGENPFLARVFKVAAFKQLYLASLQEYSKGVFQPARFHQQVDQLALVLRPAVQAESDQKLARFDEVVAGKAIRGGGFGFGLPTKPIKPYVEIRARSIADQLAGKSEGKTLDEFGFGMRGGPRRGGFGGPGGPGGPGPAMFGPGMFLGPAFMRAMDADHDDHLTREEFASGFAKWFQEWNVDRSGALTEEQIRDGINRDLSPFRAGGPPGFGPPPGAADREQ